MYFDLANDVMKKMIEERKCVEEILITFKITYHKF
jgi:hypothetical protein